MLRSDRRETSPASTAYRAPEMACSHRPEAESRAAGHLASPYMLRCPRRGFQIRGRGPEGPLPRRLVLHGARIPERPYGQPWDAGMSRGPAAGAAKKVATNTVTPVVAFQAV